MPPAAITGTGESSSARAQRRNSACCSIHSASVSALRSFRSAPAQKPLPAPLSTTARMSFSPRMLERATSSKASMISCAISVLKALYTSGRFSSTESTCPDECCSSSRFCTSSSSVPSS